jgi:hypothetical protein
VRAAKFIADPISYAGGESQWSIRDYQLIEGRPFVWLPWYVDLSVPQPWSKFDASRALADRAFRGGVKLDFTPGKPTDNGQTELWRRTRCGCRPPR